MQATQAGDHAQVMRAGGHALVIHACLRALESHAWGRAQASHAWGRGVQSPCDLLARLVSSGCEAEISCLLPAACCMV